MTAQFTTETFSSLALADMLGQLGYLPGSWRVPNLGLQVASRLGSAGSGLAGALQLAYDPPPGTMSLEQGAWKPAPRYARLSASPEWPCS